MWLKPPRRDVTADDVQDPATIEQLKADGWQEVPPLWIRHGKTDVVHYVTHPEHQKRLLADGGAIVADPNAPVSPPEPQEPIVATIGGKSYTQADLDAVAALLGGQVGDHGSTNDHGEPDHEGAPDDQRSVGAKRAVRR